MGRSEFGWHGQAPLPVRMNVKLAVAIVLGPATLPGWFLENLKEVRT